MFKKNAKTAGAAVSDFSEKYSRAKSEGSAEEVKIVSALEPVQEKINDYEKERIEKIKKQFMDFFNPLTQDIEEDEENLVKAYKLYCQLVELNETVGDFETHIKDFSITSPLCKKTEYISGERFLYLRLWFLTTNPDSAYVPEITALAGGGFSMTFMEKDLWKPSITEREIQQIISTMDNY